MAYEPNVVGFLGGAMNNPPAPGAPGTPPTGGAAAAGAGAVASVGGPAPKPVTPRMKINDTRRINPGTGQPFDQKSIGLKTVNADPDTMRAIVAHAKAKGVDPYTALAVAYQESEFGNKDKNIGQAWTYDPSKGIPETDTLNIEASRLTNALKDKLDYAKRLGYDKKGEDYAIQAYNGYGDLRHNLMKINGKMQPQRWYGNLVTADKPFLMSEHPLYGRSVMSLRDEILKKHAGVKNIVDTTPAYKLPDANTTPVAGGVKR